MPVFEIDGRTYSTDENGFLQNPEMWDEGVALQLAMTEGLSEMAEPHWRVVNYIRQHWLENHIAPPTRKLCKETGLTLNEIYDLFPSGPAAGACKVAGLPKPAGCV